MKSKVIGLNFEAQIFEELIVETLIAELKEDKADVLVQIQTSTGVILSPLHQYFYDSFLNDWIAAHNLTSENVFLTDDLRALSVVDVQEIYAPDSFLCEVTLVQYHTFFISDGCSLVLVLNTPIDPEFKVVETPELRQTNGGKTWFVSKS